MSFWRLIFRSVFYYRRSYAAVVVGVVIATAVLTGGLVVGDSVAYTKKMTAKNRLGDIETALVGGERKFGEGLARRMGERLGCGVAGVVELDGTAVSVGTGLRANHVKVLGVDDYFWELGGVDGDVYGEWDSDGVVLNDGLARRLGVGVGDMVVLRMNRLSDLSRDTPLACTVDDEAVVGMRVEVVGVVGDDEFGRFSLVNDQVSPLNAFLRLGRLQERVGMEGMVNMLLVGGVLDGDVVDEVLRECWSLEDMGVEVRVIGGDAEEMVEVRSDRVFLDRPICETAMELGGGEGVLCYMIDEVRGEGGSTPYGMIAGIESGLVEGLKENEIVVNEWMAKDLGVVVGDEVVLRYFVLGTMRRLIYEEKKFEVVKVVGVEGDLEGELGDREMMPEFPGIENVDDMRKWDAGELIDMDRIGERDEEYWKRYRGTPRGFVKLEVAKEMWGNRFGELTAVRYEVGEGEVSSEVVSRVSDGLLGGVGPMDVGLFFEDVWGEAEKASGVSNGFSELFFGFSMFLVAAALILMAMLFGFGVEQRREEVRTLFALGFTGREVKRVLLGEGMMLAVIGVVIGVVFGVVYTELALIGLGTIWKSAFGATRLVYYAEAGSLAAGGISGLVVALVTIVVSVGRHLRTYRIGRSKDRYVSGDMWYWGIAVVSGVIGVVVVVMGFGSEGTSAATISFVVGVTLLVFMVAMCGVLFGWLGFLHGEKDRGGKFFRISSVGLTMVGLGLRNCGRRRGRSLGTVGMFACGMYIVIMLGASRIVMKGDVWDVRSGTGGFGLWGETSLGVYHDMNSEEGRNEFGLSDEEMAGISVVQLRAHRGDDASCLNMNRAQRPRLMGVDGEKLKGRFEFQWCAVEDGLEGEWGVLDSEIEDDSDGGLEGECEVVAGVVNHETLLWALRRKVGDSIDYTDERGRKFKVKIMGTLVDSVFQGIVVIGEKDLMRLYPSESGYKTFLIDVEREKVEEARRVLSVGMSDVGLEVMSAVDRVGMFHEIKNIYITIFKVIGVLALLLASVGLGVVVMRNIFERRGELALMRAVGFDRREVGRLILGEHCLLLLLGLACGIVSAGVAVGSVVAGGSSEVGWWGIVFAVVLVGVNGLLWMWIAMRVALREDGRGIVGGLREE